MYRLGNKITKVSGTSQQSSSETVGNEAQNIYLIKKYLKNIYISPEKKQKIIDGLRLI